MPARRDLYQSLNLSGVYYRIKHNLYQKWLWYQVRPQSTDTKHYLVLWDLAKREQSETDEPLYKVELLQRPPKPIILQNSIQYLVVPKQTNKLTFQDNTENDTWRVLLSSLGLTLDPINNSS